MLIKYDYFASSKSSWEHLNCTRGIVDVNQYGTYQLVGVVILGLRIVPKATNVVIVTGPSARGWAVTSQYLFRDGRCNNQCSTWRAGLHCGSVSSKFCASEKDEESLTAQLRIAAGKNASDQRSIVLWRSRHLGSPSCATSGPSQVPIVVDSDNNETGH